MGALDEGNSGGLLSLAGGPALDAACSSCASCVVSGTAGLVQWTGADVEVAEQKSGNLGSPAEKQETFPPGMNNAYWFAVFNALSFQIVLSSPMVLYAKGLGASATVIGVIAGMMPLLVIFQIPAAAYIPRLGFRRFVYAGWGTRVMFIFAMAVVPLMHGVLNPASQLAVLLVVLFCFNLSRGISSCAWLPWITALVPATLRGKYLARDAGVQNLASLFAFLFAGLALSGFGQPRPWQFAGLFAFSGFMGAVSLAFLKRIPDVPIPEEVRRSSKARVPWLEMARHRPFRLLLYTVMGWSVAYGGLAAFTVAFLRTAGMSEGRILLLNSTVYLGGLSSLWFVGSRLDHWGSRPVLIVAFAGWIAVMGGWIALAGGAVPVRLAPVLGLLLLMGLLASLVQMSNTRLAMSIVPEMGRNHFFAIYSVVGNVTLGLAPIGWGWLIDALGARAPVWGGLTWNNYTVFFGLAAVAFLATLILSRRLKEPAAANLEDLLRELLIDSPQRVLSRFWRINER